MTVVSTVLSSLGVAMGQVVPTLIVRTGNHGREMPLVLLLEAILPSIGFSLAFSFFRERPPIPPSRTAKERSRKIGRGDQVSNM